MEEKNHELIAKRFRQSVIVFIAFVFVACVFKIFLMTYANNEIRFGFGIFTIVFVAFLGVAPLTMGFRITSSSIFISYFAGLIWHAIQDRIEFSNLLVEPYGLYQRIFLIVCLSVIGVVVECIYQYLRNRKLKKIEINKNSEKDVFPAENNDFHMGI